MTKVVWTAAALAHLKSIRDYVAADSPGYARRLVERLIDRTEQLEEFPRSGGKVLEYDDDNIREVLQRPYRIIYRVRPAALILLRLSTALKYCPKTSPAPAD